MSRQRVRTRALRFALTFLALLSLTVHANAQVYEVWLQPVSGQWTDGEKWSTHPAYPNDDNVVIDAAGSPYTITFDVPGSGITLGFLTMISPDLTFRHTAGRLMLGTHTSGLRVGAGSRYEFSGGTLDLNSGGVVGYNGTGQFVQTRGTVFQPAGFIVGSSHGILGSGAGTLVIDGDSARWHGGSDPGRDGMYIGSGTQGTGTAWLQNRASVTLGESYVGYSGGTGTLIVNTGAQLTARRLAVGAGDGGGGVGTVLLNDNSRITLTTATFFGHALAIGGGTFGTGRGAVFVSAGSLESTSTRVGPVGTLDISGGRVALGASAAIDGQFRLAGAGIVTANQFDIHANGRVDIAGGSFSIARFGMNVSGTSTLKATGALISVGSFTQDFGTSTFGPASVLSAGGIRIGSGARFNVAGGFVSSPRLTSGGTVTYSSGTLNVASLSISGGRFTLAPGAVLRLDVDALDVLNLGVLDLNDNRLTIDYAGPSTVTELRADIARAYANGAWTGTGITSGLANATTHGLGYADVLGTSVFVRLTRYGDANLDQAVNLADFNALASHFGATNAVWSQGDFDYNGVVNLRDFNRLAANFGLSAAGPSVTPDDWAALVAAVPEPAGVLGLSVAAALGALARRRRREVCLPLRRASV